MCRMKELHRVRADVFQRTRTVAAVNVSPSHPTEYGGHGQQQGQTAVRGPPTRELQTASD